jgi:DNA replication and repair protein RecF
VRIISLQIEDLRIIERMRLAPGKRINLIVGGNGAGKTSVLEAVYLAGRGRSFRHPEAGPMIRQGAQWTRVVADIEDEVSGRRFVLGVQRERRSLHCRLDGRELHKRSLLAEALPVQWIGSQPQLLLSMGPDIRRRFLDMGLFHVEPSYLRVLSEFHRILKQRNASLRRAVPSEVELWDRRFSESSIKVSEQREAFVHELMRRSTEYLAAWQAGVSISYRYRRGWSSKSDLPVQLAEKMEADMRMGYTTVGPQRAELQIATTEGGLAEKKLSRGQQKMLVFALNIAMNDLITARTGRAPILLVDDLAAELDRQNRERLFNELWNRGGQVFVACIAAEVAELELPGTTMFHVEHGRLREGVEH